MVKISVITPTVRLEGLKDNDKALRRQTMPREEWEWIIGSPEKPEGLKTPFKWVKDRNKREGEYWTLYWIYNRMIESAQGDLIVSWQDHTYTNPDTLERFWRHYEKNKNWLVTAVGGKYADDDYQVMTWRDPRETPNKDMLYKCTFNNIEWNMCAVPKKAIYNVGGFDESLNAYSSLCGLDVNDRINMVGGYEFYTDQSIKTYSTEHGRPAGWEENLPFGEVYDGKRLEYIESPNLGYLANDKVY